eukprot:TRINITY_DN5689_c0_g1_i1.p2 TRINITY_DN5689_c0_g1~~TRINITY_DN5689_c0_g1_i1.p2  ORF type:complete len:267 (+),score=86.26 TRINITY_DN5689_c0_g1_i1:91-801(+)
MRVAVQVAGAAGVTSVEATSVGDLVRAVAGTHGERERGWTLLWRGRVLRTDAGLADSGVAPDGLVIAAPTRQPAAEPPPPWSPPAQGAAGGAGGGGLLAQLQQQLGQQQQQQQQQQPQPQQGVRHTAPDIPSGDERLTFLMEMMGGSVTEDACRRALWSNRMDLDAASSWLVERLDAGDAQLNTPMTDTELGRLWPPPGGAAPGVSPQAVQLQQQMLQHYLQQALASSGAQQQGSS